MKQVGPHRRTTYAGRWVENCVTSAAHTRPRGLSEMTCGGQGQAEGSELNGRGGARGGTIARVSRDLFLNWSMGARRQNACSDLEIISTLFAIF